ncbi:T7SS effector LXG polymorphic toxin [Shouchella clausii]|uniref:T7SS effector LXG polymorphic toxin n=1 Tax=Shouchella clausii TaxID=79880 RepID=UPI0039833B1F
MGQKSLDAAQTIDMLQEMASETSDQNGQFAGFSSWLISQHLQSGGRLSSGKTATAIANFWSEAHGPFLNLLRDVMDDFSNKLEQIQNAISDAFTREAVLKESFMMDQLYDELDQLKNVVRNFGDALADIKNEYSDVLAMPSFDDSKIEQGLTKSQEKLQETTAYLYEMDAKMKTPMEYIAEDIALMHTYVDRIRSMISNGSLSIENFSRGQIKDEEAYKNVKSVLLQRDVNNTLGYIDSFLGKPFGVFQNTFSAATEFVPGLAMGVGFYAKHGAVLFEGRTKLKSVMTDIKDSKHIKKFSVAFNGATTIVQKGYETAISHISQHPVAQNVSNKINDAFKPGGKLHAITNNRFTRALGPVGYALTGMSHLTEFTDPDNRDMPTEVKIARFTAGAITEVGGSVAGAVIGGSLLALVPGGAFVGAAIGGYVGGKIGSDVVDTVKDGAEYIVSGQVWDDAMELKDKTVDTAKNIAENVGNTVGGFFKNASKSVSSWFS